LFAGLHLRVVIVPYIGIICLSGGTHGNSYGIVDGSVRGCPRLRSFKPVSNKVADPVYKVPQVEHVIPGGEKPFTEEMMSDKLKRFSISSPSRIAWSVILRWKKACASGTLALAPVALNSRTYGGRLRFAQHHVE
jgi:hypothetical protein